MPTINRVNSLVLVLRSTTVCVFYGILGPVYIMGTRLFFLPKIQNKSSGFTVWN